MTEYRISASARVTVVTVTLEVSVGSGWGSDCGLDQVHRQAEEEALGTVARLIDLGRGNGVNGVRIVGTARVEAVLVARERT